MQILTDASSLVMSFELINGIQKPSALNLFELARLVEAIVLHDKIVVLDTSLNDSPEEQQLQIARNAIPGDFITIRKMSAYDIVTQYVDQTVPTFSRDLAKGSDYDSRVSNDRMYDPIVRKIESLLLDADRHQQEKYAELLEEIWRGTIPETQKSKRWLEVLFGSLAKGSSEKSNDTWPGLTAQRESRSNPWDGRFGPTQGSLLDVYEGQGAIFDVYCEIYRRCDPSGGSAFAQWRGRNGGRYKQFAQSMFSRTNLYILAGELLDAPYRPGALRWPICWHHFTQRHVQDSSVAEAFVRLAEKLEKGQQEQVKSFLGNGTISVTIPLFLRVAMRDCTRPEEILKKAVSLRWSSEASRFREYAQVLTQKLEEGRFDVIIRDFSECSKYLCKTFGLSEEAAKWTLLSAPSISMTPYGGFDTAGSIRATGSTLAELGAMAWKWWRRRRYGIVVRAANIAASGTSLAAEVRRVFNETLDDSEFKTLVKIESFGRTPDAQ